MRKESKTNNMNLKVDNMKITGTVKNNPEFSHEADGKKFYMMTVLVKRLSDYVDEIPVILPEELLDLDKGYAGLKVRVKGDLRSRSTFDENKVHHLSVFMFAKTLSSAGEEDPEENRVYLDGFLCKKPNYRETMSGRQVSDLFIAVNVGANRSFYIPSICWNDNAVRSQEMKVGDHVKLIGRLQSRVYKKQIDKNTSEERVAIELSISSINVVTETDDTVKETKIAG